MRRIAFLNDDRVFLRDGEPVTDAPFYRFLLGFRPYFDELVILARVAPVEAEVATPYSLSEPSVRVVPLPPYPRIASLYRHPLRYWPAIDAALRRELPGAGALWLNFGHPVSLRALRHLRRLPDVRAFAAMRGSYAKDARARAESGRARLAGAVMERNLRVFARRARAAALPCFAYGGEVAALMRRRGLTPLPLVDSLLEAEQLRAPPKPRAELAADLLFVGRLTPEKGLDLLLEALPPLCGPTGEPATLRIVGHGPELAAARAQVARLNLGSRVTFEGHVPFGPELFARYASARLLALPSRTEGMPKAACEAMAFGTPVVATRVGGLPELVTPDRGRLVAPEDPAALGRGLAALLDPACDLAPLRAAARAFGARFTRDGQVRAILSRVWPELLEERP